MTKFNFLDRSKISASSVRSARTNARAPRSTNKPTAPYDITRELRDPKPFLSTKKGRQHG